MQSLYKTAFTLTALIILTAVSHAQSVSWNPPGGQLGYGKTNRLSLIFEGCQPSGNFKLPIIDGLDISQPARSEQTSVMNFKVSRRVELSFAVQPTRRGEVIIPALNIMTDQGRVRVAETRYEVVEATVGQTNLNIDDIVTGMLRLPSEPVYNGQVIDISYLLIGSTRFSVNISSSPEWSPGDLLVEPFGEPERVTATISGEERPGLRYRTRALVRKTGPLSLSAVQQRINIQTGDNSGFFMSRPRVEEFLITSNQPTIDVKPLPAPLPEGFSGAVGHFTLESTVVPTEAQVGDPITWTVTLTGQGNWPEGITLPVREADVDFKVITPQSHKQMEEGQLFSGSLTEDVVLVPTRPGDYLLGAADFIFFNPETARFETVSSDSVTVAIESAPVSTSPRSADTLGRSTPEDTSADQLELPGVFESNEPALPGDPLPGRSVSGLPWDLPPTWWALIILGPVALTWLWQIGRRIVADDPNREAKVARRQLTRLTVSLKKSTAPEARRGQLLEWMRLAARSLCIPIAAPSSATVTRQVVATQFARNKDDWGSVWTEAENVIYGTTPDLGPDWANRAGRLVSRIRVRRRPITFLLRRRYWLPVVMLVLFGSTLSNRIQASPFDQYRAGDYAKAEVSWQEMVSSTPRDAIARNNLALTLAQQERWSEANAWWTTAFILDPGNSSLRWNLRAGLSRASGMQPRVAELLDARGLDWLATRFAPGTWNRLQAGGALLAALGLALSVYGWFRRLRPALLTAPIALVVGTIGLGLSTVSILQFGVLADPAAVVVMEDSILRSIPTDVADAQQSRNLPAGEIGRVNETFLGWRRLELDSGETGWVRQSILVPVYFPPEDDQKPNPGPT